jgi:hypothetical protein
MKTHSTLQNIGLLSLTGLFVLLPQVASAQTNFSTENFNTNAGYVRGSGIISTSQPESIRWQGNDPYNTNTTLGETDVIQRANGYTPAPPANSSLIQGGLGATGGILPGTNNVQIWKSFNSYSNYAVVSFQAEWSIIGSSLSEAPYTNSDTFAFDLRNAANTASLLKLQFTPGINLQANSYTLQTIAAGSPTGTIIDLGYGSLFTTQVDITGSTYSLSLSRLDPANRTVITNYSNLAVGSLASGTDSDDFGTIGIDWVLTSENAALPGSNYILVNDIQVVPEPSTYALFALAGSGLLGFALRKRRV